MIPTKLYFLKGKAKVEIAVAKGKKLYDKRQVKKTRDWNREKARTEPEVVHFCKRIRIIYNKSICT